MNCTHVTKLSYNLASESSVLTWPPGRCSTAAQVTHYSTLAPSLPAVQHITCKVHLLTYKLCSTSTPSYLSTHYDLWHLCVRCGTCSVDSLRLQVQHTRTDFGRWAFSIAAPTVWNALPNKLRLSSSLSTFKKHLKSLFSTAFTWQYHSSPAPLYLHDIMTLCKFYY